MTIDRCVGKSVMTILLTNCPRRLIFTGLMRSLALSLSPSSSDDSSSSADVCARERVTTDEAS